tara:strand:- start:105 stop:1466 length:1362 start_codon:yes stop_codon:yes gene_type:complete
MTERKITVMCPFNTTCGVGIFGWNLGENLEKINGNKVSYVGINEGPIKPHEKLKFSHNIYKPQSWNKLEKYLVNSDTNFLITNHEFSFDPRFLPSGEFVDCEGSHLSGLTQKLSNKKDLVHFVYLHTVPGKDKVKPFEIKELRKLAKYSDGLIVTTDGALKTLSSAPYNIPKEKIERIYHGIRINEEDGEETRRKWDAENIFLATQLGLRSLNKGNDYFIKSIGSLVHNSLTKKQRENFAGCLAGALHPKFIRQEGGKYVPIYEEKIKAALEEADVRYQIAKELEEIDWRKNDLVILDKKLPEDEFMQFYKTSDTIVQTYPSDDQVSSGIFFDTLGSGNVPTTTKIQCAVEMLNPNQPKRKGVIVTKRGILTDAGKPSIIQTAQALDYLIFNENKRLKMKEETKILGHRMNWQNVAWEALEHYKWVRDRKNDGLIKGFNFKREKTSPLEIRLK